MSFSDRLAKARRGAGLTQTELAAAIGAAQSTISQLEKGTRKPSLDMLEGIAETLQLSTAYLLGEGVEGLTAEEESHFLEYRALSKEAREELREYATFLQQKHKSGGKRP